MKIIDPKYFYNLEGRNLLAIDIGAKGGAVWNDKRQLYSMSTTNETDVMLRLLRCGYFSVIVAENVHTFGGQGIVSNGTLMQARGRWEGVVAGLGLQPIKFIEPKAWIQCYTHKKKDNFKDTKAWKNHLMQITQESQQFITITSSGISDTWMIWNYYALTLVDDNMRPIGEFQFS